MRVYTWRVLSCRELKARGDYFLEDSEKSLVSGFNPPCIPDFYLTVLLWVVWLHLADSIWKKIFVKPEKVGVDMRDLCPVDISVVVANGDHFDQCPAFIRQKRTFFRQILTACCNVHHNMWSVCRKWDGKKAGEWKKGTFFDAWADSFHLPFC